MSESEAELPSAFVGDVLLWKRWHVSLGVIVVATVAWVLFEWTSLPFLTICSDVCFVSFVVGDVLLWKRWHVSLGVIVVATVAWVLFEWTSLPFLTICSDVLLILIVLLFLHANYAALRNKQPPTLPELVVSEEMVNNVAASFRVKINNMLLIAHDITIGKDFRIFFKVVICLWLLSVIGSVFSFFTLAYIGTLMMITIPALYRKYGGYVDKCCGVIHRQFSKHYRIVDESVFNRLPRNISKDKES